MNLFAFVIIWNTQSCNCYKVYPFTVAIIHVPLNIKIQCTYTVEEILIMLKMHTYQQVKPYNAVVSVRLVHSE